MSNLVQKGRYLISQSLLLEKQKHSCVAQSAKTINKPINSFTSCLCAINLTRGPSWNLNVLRLSENISQKRIQYFEMERQPQIPEFRNNHENFHPGICISEGKNITFTEDESSFQFGKDVK